jgi:hypothetical protein
MKNFRAFTEATPAHNGFKSEVCIDKVLVSNIIYEINVEKWALWQVFL